MEEQDPAHTPSTKLYRQQLLSALVFRWAFARPGRAVRCWAIPPALLHSPGSWEAQTPPSAAAPRFASLLGARLFWAPDSPFAEPFELNGSSWNAVVLAENKS